MFGGMGMGNLFGGMGGGGFFESNYRCYPVAFIEKESAEAGDKVILPPSALEKLASMHVEYPMLFRAENKREGNVTHCGVLEFVAQEGMCYMPHWMMQNLLLTEGALVNLKNVSLPKGTFVKIQPHTSDFLDISNPKAVLETSMRVFTCLTQGDTFVINYNGKKYYIDALEVKPNGAVSVIETDLSVDFAPPKDYVEPDYKGMAAAAAAKEAATAAAAAGPSTSASAAPAAEEEEAEPTFLAFNGGGNRLDGKAAGPSRPVAVPLSKLTGRPVPPPDPAAEKGPAKSTNNIAGQKAGTFVGGGGGAGGLAASNRLAARLANKGAAPKAPEAKKEPEAPKFSAFGGPPRKLGD